MGIFHFKDGCAIYLDSRRWVVITPHFTKKVTFDRNYYKHWGNHGKAFFGHFNWRISLRKSTLGTFEKNFGKIGQS